MAAVTTMHNPYDRQISTESGWENPFRPGGDLSREADEIVNMIKGGKPITPTGDNAQIIYNGGTQQHENIVENGKNVQDVVDVVTKQEVSQSQSTQNGTKTSHQNKPENINKEQSKNISQTQVSKQVVPGPTSASHVVIENKKKKNCSCCVIQ